MSLSPPRRDRGPPPAIAAARAPATASSSSRHRHALRPWGGRARTGAGRPREGSWATPRPPPRAPRNEARDGQNRASERIASCRCLRPSRAETSFTGPARTPSQRLPPLVGGGHARQRPDSGARSPPPPARRARGGSSGEQRMRACAGRQGWCTGEPARRWLSAHCCSAKLIRRGADGAPAGRGRGRASACMAVHGRLFTALEKFQLQLKAFTLRLRAPRV